MIYLPDTNAFSTYLGGRSPALTGRMRLAFAAGELRLSVMVLAELTFGAEKIRTKLGDTKFTRRVEALRTQLEVEPLRESLAEHYAAVRLHLESAGQKIGDRDTIIAAHALALGGPWSLATLASSNACHDCKWRIGRLSSLRPAIPSRFAFAVGSDSA